MKKILLLFILILSSLFFQNLHAQQQPVLNSSFENWSKQTLPYQVPNACPPTDRFKSSNEELLYVGLTNMTKIPNGGGSAMRLQTISYTTPNGLDTAVAYALWGGDPKNGSLFPGGFPFTDQNVTGIKLDLRYNINVLSAGMMIVQFKKNGVAIGGGNAPLNMPGIYTFPIAGNQATFTNTTFTFNPVLPMQPDTCVIAFASNEPFDHNVKSYPGNFLEVDNIQFTGSSQTVPGGNFESWVQGTTDFLPFPWAFGEGRDGGGIVNRTTDSYSGSYAMSVSVVLTGDGNNYGERVNLGTPQYGTPTVYKPGQKMNGRAQALGFYYKYSTPGVDTAQVYVRLTKYSGGTRQDVGDGWAYLLPQASYGYYSVMLNYYNGIDIPDSAYIEFGASKNWNNSVLGSTLKVDDVTLNYCNENLSVSGTTSVAMNATGVSYSTQDSPGATFAWTVPAGATIVSGAGTSSITVNFSGTGGQVYVIKTYADGCPNKFASLNVTVQSTAVAWNGGFELWAAKPLPYVVPAANPPTKGFEVSNQQLVKNGLTNVTKIPNGGGYAMRLEAIDYVQPAPIFKDTTFGYAIWGTSPQGGTQFNGGFPFTDKNVTAIKMDIRYNINALSPGLVLVQFKKNGVAIGGGNAPLNMPGMYAFQLSGSQASFTNMTFMFNPALPVQPDTCIIGFVTNDPFTNPKKAYPGDFIEVDNIVFTGTSQTIPAGNLDLWATAMTEELPIGWNFDDNEGLDGSNKTGDAKAGNYAVQLRVIDHGNGDKQLQNVDLGMPIWGSPTIYNPGAAINGRPNSVGFYYKYTTPGVDTASVYMRLTKWNSGTHTRDDVGSVWTYMLPSAGYQFKYGLVSYQNGLVPDSVYIQFSASNNWNTAVGGSTLKVDEVSFNYCNEVLSISGNNSVCPNATGVVYSVSPTTGSTYAWTLPAGASITSGSGTDKITVTFGATAGNIGVTKTYVDGCPNTATNLNVTNNGTATANAGSDFSMCANNAGILNGTVTGAAGGTWSGGTGTFSPNNTTLNASYSPSPAEKAAGTATLTLTTTGGGTCAPASDQVVITITPAPTASTPATASVCVNNADVTLAGSVTIAAGGKWTGGTGSFTPNNTALNAVYSPSAAEKAAGSVTLTLTTTGNGTCNAVTKNIVITMTPAANANLSVSQVTPICQGTNGTVTVLSSENGVSYQASIAGIDVGTPVVGNGSTITLTIPSASMAVGSNSIMIEATKTSCSSVLLNNSATIVVNAPVAPTFTFNGATKNFGDAPFTISATSNSAGALTYSFVSSVPANILTVAANGSVTINGAGTATVKVDQVANACFTAGSQTATITVNKANRTATITSTNTGTMNGTINLTNTVSAGTGAATWSVTNGTGSATVSGSTLTLTGAGTVTVRVDVAADANYNATFVTQTITINKANRTAAVTSANNGTVNGTINLTNTVSAGTGTATWSVTNGTGSATVSGTTLTLTGAGTVTVTVSIAADANYNATSATQTITIAKANRTATITSTNTGTVGGTINLTNTVSAGTGTATWTVSNVTGTATVSGSTLTLTGAGTVTVTVSVAADANYNATSATQTITINKASRTSTITSVNSGTVGGTINLTNTVSAGTGAVTWSVTNGTGSATVSGTTLTLTGAGTVTVQVDIAADANYNATSATQIITIGKATRTVSITSTSNGSISGTINLTYTTVPAGGTATWSVTNGTGSATVSGSTLTLVSAGTVTVQVDIAADANYNAATATQTVTISSQPTPTITFNNASKVFGDPMFSNTATSNSTGALTYSLLSSTPAGIVTVAANGDVTITGAGTAIVKVDQAADVSFGAGSATATITIAKANRTATITSTNSGTVDGTVNLTNTVSGGTGIGSWSVTNGTGSATVSGTTLTLTGAGTITVQVDIPADANYNATSANQSFTVAKANRTVSITSANNGIISGTTTLTYSTTPAGGTATWSVVNGTGSATLSGNTLTHVSLGTVTLTVDIAADANYNAATATQTFTITPNQTPQPGAFTVFTNPVTQGDQAVTYTVPNVPGTNYSWVYTGGTGATIVGTGNSITINFSNTATSGTLSVIADNGAGPSVPRDINITVQTLNSIAVAVVANIKAYPNPFETTSVIEFELTTGGDVNLEVYDMLGVKQQTLINGETLGAGYHSASLSDLNAGAYVVKLKVGNKEKVIKVIKN